MVPNQVVLKRASHWLYLLLIQGVQIVDLEIQEVHNYVERVLIRILEFQLEKKHRINNK